MQGVQKTWEKFVNWEGEANQLLTLCSPDIPCGLLCSLNQYKVQSMALTILILNKTLFFFSLSHTNDKTKSISFYFFTKHKTSHFSYSVYKHDAIDIANTSSMQDACHTNFVLDLVTVKSLWLSSRALDRGIRRSEVGFLMGTQNFFFVPCLWQDENIFL